jgi:hypothetical protein
MAKRRNGPAVSSRAAAKTATVCDQSTEHPDLTVDLALIGPNADIWAMLFDGTFRLARKCDICGRWLTSHASKAAGRGPSCAARSAH